MPSNGSEYAKSYQKRHRKKITGQAKARRAATKNKNRLIVERFKDQICMDCGNRFPIECMDFDHVRGQKIKNISQMVHHNSTDALLEEIAKCEVVCSNCHRIRTTARRRAKGTR